MKFLKLSMIGLASFGMSLVVMLAVETPRAEAQLVRGKLNIGSFVAGAVANNVLSGNGIGIAGGRAPIRNLIGGILGGNRGGGNRGEFRDASAYRQRGNFQGFRVGASPYRNIAIRQNLRLAQLNGYDGRRNDLRFAQASHRYNQALLLNQLNTFSYNNLAAQNLAFQRHVYRSQAQFYVPPQVSQQYYFQAPAQFRAPIRYAQVIAPAAIHDGGCVVPAPVPAPIEEHCPPVDSGY